MEKTAVTVKICRVLMWTRLRQWSIKKCRNWRQASIWSQLPKSLYGRRWIWRESYIPYVVNMKPC